MSTLRRCLTTRYTSKKSSCYDLVVILHQQKKDSLNVSILHLVKIILVTSHRDVIAAFKARWIFLAITLDILRNFYKENFENIDLENSDTFDGWFCDFLFWRLFC